MIRTALEIGRAIGFYGIKYIPEIDLPEIGYRYLNKCWGRGIGTEAGLYYVHGRKRGQVHLGIK